MANSIQLQYKTVFLSPLQVNIIKELEIHPEGMIRGQNHEEGSLMKALNKARTTVYDNLTALERLGKVQKVIKNEGVRGRPKTYWKLI